MIFLSLKGTPYEVGFQHGKRLKDLIYYNIRFFCTEYDKESKIAPLYYLEIQGVEKLRNRNAGHQ